uniref:Candidate secreted effector n=1 Tax=Meloidogyne incognita TaxID=6306 RepID=A0A914M461_MELIC
MFVCSFPIKFRLFCIFNTACFVIIGPQSRPDISRLFCIFNTVCISVSIRNFYNFCLNPNVFIYFYLNIFVNIKNFSFK